MGPLLATLKHYVGHSASEGGRNHAPVHLGQRELADDFMLPFEMAVKGANKPITPLQRIKAKQRPSHSRRDLMWSCLQTNARRTWKPL